MLFSTSAGSMGLDVPQTNLVVINSAPSTDWEFSQEVNIVHTADLGFFSNSFTKDPVYTTNNTSVG